MAYLNKTIWVIMLALGLALSGGAAWADTFDFADPGNAALYHGQTSFTVGGFLPGVDMKVNAYTIAWTGDVGNSAYTVLGNGTMYYDNWRSAGDYGLGINGIYPGTGAYEIGVNEMLDITFVDSLTQAPVDVLIQSVNLALFFANESQGGYTYNETGFYDFNRSMNFTLMEANQTIYNPQTDGLYTINPNQVASSLQLIGGLGNPTADDRKSEYKLQDVAVVKPSAATPEPGTMLLLGSAIGLAALRRRMKKA